MLHYSTPPLPHSNTFSLRHTRSLSLSLSVVSHYIYFSISSTSLLHFFKHTTCFSIYLSDFYYYLNLFIRSVSSFSISLQPTDFLSTYFSLKLFSLDRSFPILYLALTTSFHNLYMYLYFISLLHSVYISFHSTHPYEDTHTHPWPFSLSISSYPV